MGFLTSRARSATSSRFRLGRSSLTTSWGEPPLCSRPRSADSGCRTRRVFAGCKRVSSLSTSLLAVGLWRLVLGRLPRHRAVVFVALHSFTVRWGQRLRAWMGRKLGKSFAWRGRAMWTTRQPSVVLQSFAGEPFRSRSAVLGAYPSRRRCRRTCSTFWRKDPSCSGLSAKFMRHLRLRRVHLRWTLC